MAAVVRCDCCSDCIDYKHATHIRAYQMDSATTYNSRTLAAAELCPGCYSRLLKMIGKEDESNAKSGHH